MLKGHRSRVRALVCSANGKQLISAAIDIRVWEVASLAHLFTLVVPSEGLLASLQEIYSLAVCRVDEGFATSDTLYAGGKDHVYSWRLSAQGDDYAQVLSGGRIGKVRALACHGSVLLGGDGDGYLRAWDLTRPAAPPVVGLPDDVHTARVRAIDVDAHSNVVYTAADDRCVKVWGNAELEPERDGGFI